MIALLMGHNLMEVMLYHEKVTVSVQKTLSQMIIITTKWMLLMTVFIGKDKRNWVKVKGSTHVQHGKIFGQNFLGLLAKERMPLCPLKHGTVSLQMKLLITLFNTQMSIFLLSNLTSAMKVMPNSQTKLR
jgi:hypothetical protein